MKPGNQENKSSSPYSDTLPDPLKHSDTHALIAQLIATHNLIPATLSLNIYPFDQTTHTHTQLITSNQITIAVQLVQIFTLSYPQK